MPASTAVAETAAGDRHPGRLRDQKNLASRGVPPCQVRPAKTAFSIEASLEGSNRHFACNSPSELEWMCVRFQRSDGLIPAIIQDMPISNTTPMAHSRDPGNGHEPCADDGLDQPRGPGSHARHGFHALLEPFARQKLWLKGRDPAGTGRRWCAGIGIATATRCSSRSASTAARATRVTKAVFSNVSTAMARPSPSRKLLSSTPRQFTARQTSA